jgi:hypothetical protein
MDDGKRLHGGGVAKFNGADHMAKPAGPKPIYLQEDPSKHVGINIVRNGLET